MIMDVVNELLRILEKKAANKEVLDAKVRIKPENIAAHAQCVF